ncbi:hypothetical protein TRFO_23893 [Tritrichomonas foetus]|uniref:Uncharacterized protein n=1 Tax=Tritrichomonas foetus TaxID=1144522 RepID=A0A1J4K8P6_9EUKA|nr:hypothetical protein TRFO_23893 [Tritrichomonas foetus]|eukprot:OHT07783.1 hypothetical protein TRFO_23893 [Tritrichomonas foetus]
MNVSFSPLHSVNRRIPTNKTFTKAHLILMSKLLADLKSENREYKSSMKKLVNSTEDILIANQKLQKAVNDRRNYIQELTNEMSNIFYKFQRSNFRKESANHRLKKFQKYILKQTCGIERERLNNEILGLTQKIDKLKEETKEYMTMRESEENTIQHIMSLNDLKIDLIIMNKKLRNEALKLLQMINFSNLKFDETLQNRIQALQIKMEEGEIMRQQLIGSQDDFSDEKEFYHNLNDKLQEAVPVFTDLEKLLFQSQRSTQFSTLCSSKLSSLLDAEKIPNFQNLPEFKNEVEVTSLLDHPSISISNNLSNKSSPTKSSPKGSGHGSPIVIRPEIAYAIQKQKLKKSQVIESENRSQINSDSSTFESQGNYKSRSYIKKLNDFNDKMKTKSKNSKKRKKYKEKYETSESKSENEKEEEFLFEGKTLLNQSSNSSNNKKGKVLMLAEVSSISDNPNSSIKTKLTNNAQKNEARVFIKTKNDNDEFNNQDIKIRDTQSKYPENNSHIKNSFKSESKIENPDLKQFMNNDSEKGSKINNSQLQNKEMNKKNTKKFKRRKKRKTQNLSKDNQNNENSTTEINITFSNSTISTNSSNSSVKLTDEQNSVSQDSTKNEIDTENPEKTKKTTKRKKKATQKSNSYPKGDNEKTDHSNSKIKSSITPKETLKKLKNKPKSHQQNVSSDGNTVLKEKSNINTSKKRNSSLKNQVENASSSSSIDSETNVSLPRKNINHSINQRFMNDDKEENDNNKNKDQKKKRKNKPTSTPNINSDQTTPINDPKNKKTKNYTSCPLDNHEYENGNVESTTFFQRRLLNSNDSNHHQKELIHRERCISSESEDDANQTHKTKRISGSVYEKNKVKTTKNDKIYSRIPKTNKNVKNDVDSKHHLSKNKSLKLRNNFSDIEDSVSNKNSIFPKITQPIKKSLSQSNLRNFDHQFHFFNYLSNRIDPKVNIHNFLQLKRKYFSDGEMESFNINKESQDIGESNDQKNNKQTKQANLRYKSKKELLNTHKTKTISQQENEDEIDSENEYEHEKESYKKNKFHNEKGNTSNLTTQNEKEKRNFNSGQSTKKNAIHYSKCLENSKQNHTKKSNKKHLADDDSIEYEDDTETETQNDSLNENNAFKQQNSHKLHSDQENIGNDYSPVNFKSGENQMLVKFHADESSLFDYSSAYAPIEHPQKLNFTRNMNDKTNNNIKSNIQAINESENIEFGNTSEILFDEENENRSKNIKIENEEEEIYEESLEKLMGKIRSKGSNPVFANTDENIEFEEEEEIIHNNYFENEHSQNNNESYNQNNTKVIMDDNSISSIQSTSQLNNSLLSITDKSPENIQDRKKKGKEKIQNRKNPPNNNNQIENSNELPLNSQNNDPMNSPVNNPMNNSINKVNDHDTTGNENHCNQASVKVIKINMKTGKKELSKKELRKSFSMKNYTFVDKSNDSEISPNESKTNLPNLKLDQLNSHNLKQRKTLRLNNLSHAKSSLSFLNKNSIYQTETTTNLLINKETVEANDPFQNEFRSNLPISQTKWANDLFKSNLAHQLNKTHLQIAISEAQYLLSKINDEITDLEDQQLLLSFELRQSRPSSFKIVNHVFSTFIPPSIATNKYAPRKVSLSFQTKLTGKMLEISNEEITKNNFILARESITESQKLAYDAHLPLIQAALEKILRKNDRMDSAIAGFEARIGTSSFGSKGSKEKRLRMRYERAIKASKQRNYDLDEQITNNYKLIDKYKFEIAELRKVHEQIKEKLSIERKAPKVNAPQLSHSLKGYKAVERWNNEKMKMLEIENSQLDQRILDLNHRISDKEAFEIRNLTIKNHIDELKDAFFSGIGKKIKNSTSPEEIDWLTKVDLQMTGNIEALKNKEKRLITLARNSVNKLANFKVPVPPSKHFDTSEYN